MKSANLFLPAQAMISIGARIHRLMDAQPHAAGYSLPTAIAACGDQRPPSALQEYSVATSNSTHTYLSGTVTTASQSFTGPGSLLVQEDALVIPFYDAFDLTGGPWTVSIYGAVTSGYNALWLGAAATTRNSSISIGTEGALWSGNAAAISSAQPVDIKNAGSIWGQSYGIYLNSADPTPHKMSITNAVSGEIGQISGVPAIYQTDPAWSLTVTNSGQILSGAGAGAYAILSEGALTLTNTKTGLLNGYIDVFSTAVINNAGTMIVDDQTIGYGMYLRGAGSKATNSGTFEGDYWFRGGHSTLTNSGETLGAVVADNGHNVVTNSGAITGNVIFTAGDDKLTNTGHIGGHIQADIGGVTLMNSGVVDGIANLGHHTINDAVDHVTNLGTLGGLTCGSGNDVVSNSGTIGGIIDLGVGDDKFTGGSHADIVRDNSGNDTYKLAGGNDTFYDYGLGHFVADGGTGTDILDLGNVGSACSVNLDSKDMPFLFGIVPAHSVNDSTAGSGTVTGFEQVNGSGYTDLIHGSSANETLNGNGGDDLLIGGLGRDTLTGGAGNDYFTFQSIKDSGTTIAASDVITDFQGAGAAGGDTLDFGSIDANTKLTSDQAFSFIGDNVGFSHNAGELRAIWHGSDSLVQADVNGDGRADFQVILTGHQALTADDINL
jgi:hypothetical protein